MAITIESANPLQTCFGYRDPTIDLSAELQPRFSKLGDGLSEYCSSDLCLFRNAHRYRVIQGQRLFVQERTHDGLSFLMPLFDPAAEDTGFPVEMIQPYDFYFPISGSMRSHFDRRAFDTVFSRHDSMMLR
jgi:hypothetical protein